MNKQEEIREGIFDLLESGAMLKRLHTGQQLDDTTSEILSYLYSRGVVIKVDRELPLDGFHMASQFPKTFNGSLDIVDYCEEKAKYLDIAQPIMEGMLKAGYVAVEPLIK